MTPLMLTILMIAGVGVLILIIVMEIIRYGRRRKLANP
jgi:hypothetical protein